MMTTEVKAHAGVNGRVPWTIDKDEQESEVSIDPADKPRAVIRPPLVSFAGVVRGDELVLPNAVVGGVAADRVAIQKGFVRAAIAGRELRLERGGAGTLVAAGDAALHQAGAQAVFAAGSIRMSQAGSGLAIAQDIQVADHGTVVFGVTPHLEVANGGRVLFGPRTSFAVFGGMIALLAGVAWVVIRGARRR